MSVITLRCSVVFFCWCSCRCWYWNCLSDKCCVAHDDFMKGLINIYLYFWHVAHTCLGYVQFRPHVIQDKFESVLKPSKLKANCKSFRSPGTWECLLSILNSSQIFRDSSLEEVIHHRGQVQVKWSVWLILTWVSVWVCWESKLIIHFSIAVLELSIISQDLDV